MNLQVIKAALLQTYKDIDRYYMQQMAAALSHYLVLSIFPALIFLSIIVAYLPFPDLLNHALTLLANFVPDDSMGLIRIVLTDHP